jgi:hypothetical protein
MILHSSRTRLPPGNAKEAPAEAGVCKMAAGVLPPPWPSEGRDAQPREVNLLNPRTRLYSAANPVRNPSSRTAGGIPSRSRSVASLEQRSCAWPDVSVFAVRRITVVGVIGRVVGGAYRSGASGVAVAADGDCAVIVDAPVGSVGVDGRGGGRGAGAGRRVSPRVG